MKESSLALYFLHLVGEGGISQHPEVKATAFGDISASDDVTAYISNHMLECAGRTFLQELEPWNQQVLILGDANTPLVSLKFKFYEIFIDPFCSLRRHLMLMHLIRISYSPSLGAIAK